MRTPLPRPLPRLLVRPLVAALIATTLGTGCSESGGTAQTPGTDGATPPSAVRPARDHGATGASPTATTVGAPGIAPTSSLIAQASPSVDSIGVSSSPGGDSLTGPTGKPVNIPNPNENGVAAVFGVISSDIAAPDGTRWHQVRLPVRPNGSTGWVRAADVQLQTTPYYLSVDLSEHRLTLYDAGKVTKRFPVGLGVATTPTAVGRFYLRELLQPDDPGDVYGPFAYGLSGFSEVLDEFAGGDGRLGLHGTNDPDSVGTDVSHGCIRLKNPDITYLTGLLPLGTPIDIVA